ncbi:MAG: pyridoxamine 5'-phosphate oxidase [Flavobacteriaceae bacterium TMED42]|nr:MAG: pyridoxamine 5'-phosphate oxidase [Flavobacteriaceae bacterium TMED42]|tara:strand:+ start:1357 stop:2016 length:660 start_codon:yes stop_codon:yes gene_type:complete
MSSRETKPKLADLRKSYDKATLDLDHVKDNPLQFFQTWFYEAKEADGIDEANAMSLTTLGDDGFPRARVVLLKDFSEEGFVFFTNYNSEKGKSLLKHPKVGLSFYWPSLERQIIIKGEAEKLSENKSDQYFETRPRGSQLGAHVSPQSEVIPDRKFLEDLQLHLDKKFENTEIPRPDHWGGILVRPHEIEFWQGRPNRLHDRICCYLDGIDWKAKRLAP